MPAACPVQFFRLQMDGDGVFAAAKSERYAIECPLIGKRSDRPWFDGILPLWASAPFEWVEAGRGFPFFLCQFSNKRGGAPTGAGMPQAA